MPIRLQQLAAPAITALVAAAVCVATWFISPIVSIPLILISSGAVGVAIAMQSPKWTTLKLNIHHLVIWGLVGTAAAAFALRGCLSYNEVAGTDKTPLHILQICTAVFAGPLVGPIANSGAGADRVAVNWTLTLLVLVLAALSPFLLLRRPVSKYIAAIAWIVYLAVTVVWFMGAMISLAFYLS